MGFIDDHWNDPISSLVDSLRGRGRIQGREIGQDDLPYAYLEVDDDGNLLIGVVEYLQFATERGDLVGMVDDHGWLLPEALDNAVTTLSGYLWTAGVPCANALSADDAGGDEPNVDFSLQLTLDTSKSVQQFFDTVADPFFATVQNVTDPGTFNRPYLWIDAQR